MKRTLLLLTVFLAIMLRAQEFTIVTLPDIQNMTWQPRDENLYKEMQYVIDSRANLNTKFVVSLGDLTADGYNGTSPHSQWQITKQSSDMLVNAGIPYAVCAGNHDMDFVPDYNIPTSYTRFNQYYPVSDFEDKSYFGGYYRDMSNGYYLFSAGGMDFIIVVLQNLQEAAYDQGVADWANSILEQHADRRAIISTHMLYQGDNYMTNIISQHDNVFMAVFGHHCADNGERYWTANTPSGKTIHCMMSDYQCRDNTGGGAVLRWYTFQPNENKIYAYTYNTYTDQFETDASSQFSFDYEMVEQPPQEIPGIIEAESYSSMFGVQREATSDTGGGQNVGYITTDDWMSYKVDVAHSGLYTIEYRVASKNGGGELQLEEQGGGKVYGTSTVPNTEDWQNWTTITDQIQLDAGVQNITIKALSGGWNINWFKIGNNDSTYSLTASNNGTGSISLDPEGGVYAANTIVTATATAAPGWQFINWSGDVSGTDSVIVVTMSSDKNIIANYEIDSTVIGEPILCVFDYDLTLTSHGCPEANKFCQTVCSTYGWTDQCQAIDAQEVIAACIERGARIGIASHADRSQCWDSKITPIVTQQQLPALTNSIRYDNAMADFTYPKIDEWDNWNGSSSAYHLNPSISKSQAISRIMVHYGMDPASEADQSRVIFWDDSNGNIVDVNTYMPNVNTVEVGRFGSGSDGGCGITMADFEQGWSLLSDEQIIHDIPGKIEAESYSSMFGVQMEECSEGTQNVGWIAADDWMSYEINVPESGYYQVCYRVASVDGGSMQLQDENGNSLSEAINVPATGAWQEWTTVCQELELTAGVQEIKIYALIGGWNINWLEFTDIPDNFILTTNTNGSGTILLTPDGAVHERNTTVTATAIAAEGWHFVNWTGDANGNGVETVIDMDADKQIEAVFEEDVAFTLKIEAEDYDIMSGIQTEDCSEGTQNVGWTDAGDWMAYHDIDLPTPGTYTVEYRVASFSGGGTIKLEQDAGTTLLGEIDVPYTGGWQTWTTISHTVTIAESGPQDFGLAAATGGFNINWLQFTAGITPSMKSTGLLPESFAVSIYPNPATDELRISSTAFIRTIRVFDVSGRVLTTVSEVNSYSQQLDVSSFQSGMLLIKVETEFGTEIQKVFKK